MENKAVEPDRLEGQYGAINVDKKQVDSEEAKMKTDEVNLTVDPEENTESDGERCGAVKDRKRLQGILHSHRFQMIIIFLVAIDFLIVLVQLLMDIQVIKGVHHDHLAIETLHFTSIAILGLFLVEIVIKIYAFGFEFFHHRLEVFDAIVVIVSFALDVAYSGNADAWDAVGLLVLLRLWRIVRIANGIILSVKIEMDEKMKHVKAAKKAVEEQLEFYKNKCNKQEKQITELEAQLRES